MTRDVTRPNETVANALMAADALDVVIAETHEILSEPAVRRLADSPAIEVIVNNTLPIPSDKQLAKLTVLSIAPLLGRAFREVFENGSVTSLFDGDA